jgi:hypothetical protein
MGSVASGSDGVKGAAFGYTHFVHVRVEHGSTQGEHPPPFKNK